MNAQKAAFLPSLIALASRSSRSASARLVLADEPLIADHVGGEDRGEAAGRGQVSGIAALRRLSRYRARQETRTGVFEGIVRNKKVLYSAMVLICLPGRDA